jgi:type I restriction enzyme R subunit
MIKSTSETAFEEYIEHSLLEKSGWRQGSKVDWDVKLAVFAPEIIAFIKKTQPALWDQMQKLHGAELETKLIDALCKLDFSHLAV